MPIYRESPLIIKFSMLCPGISQNTKHHHLTLYKGQVWEEKPYPELCNHNVLDILYGWTANYNIYKWPIEQNGELYVPPVPSEEGFVRGNSAVAWDSEILESFAELTDITDITFHFYDTSEDSLEGVTWQVELGIFQCVNLDGNHEKCPPPTLHYPWYIWTKEGFQILI